MSPRLINYAPLAGNSGASSATEGQKTVVQIALVMLSLTDGADVICFRP